MGLSISTSWNALRWIDSASPGERAERMIAELSGLGFDTVELSFNLDIGVVNEIRRFVKDGSIKISSLHNICPIPPDTEPEEASPDYYSLASPEESERALAIKYAKRTIETAAELGAGAVVLHAGRVEMEGGTKALAELYENGLKDTREYTDLMDKMIAERKRLKPPYIAAILKSLDEIVRSAEKNAVKLGVETRIYAREIPSFEEIGVILDKFKGSSAIGYWHDTGHAQYAQTLGFTKHRDFLDAYSDRMIGLHLHDIKRTRDHLAPGSGGLDFSILKAYIRPDMIKVLEPHKPATAEEIMRGAKYLEKALS